MLSRKTNLHKAFGLSIAVIMVLSACRAPAGTEGEVKAPTQDINALYTQVAGTLIAQGQQADSPQATNTPVVVTATDTPTPEGPTATPSNTPITPTNTAAVACNQAAFITDVTVADNTKMAKGEDFTKTWRIKNTGTCTWDKDDYTVVYSSGTNLASKSSYSLSKDVSPGDTIDISIAMEAPSSNGTYTSNWLLRSGNGDKFGVGGSANSAGVPFFALIKVGNTSSSSSSGEYDFAANYCDAKWSSNTKNNLPCPGANSGTDGFVLVLQNPELETRHENEPAIWMRPNHAGSGYIQGVFPKYEISNKEHFVAVIGCLDNNPQCEVTFKLSYIKANGDEVVLGTWDEKFDDNTTHIDFDLSSLAGKTVQFVLTVKTGNSNYKQANAFWFVPHIEKQ